MLRIGIIAFLLVVLFPALSHAQKACTEIGCQNGLSFTVDPSYDWKPGQYEIFVVTGLKQAVCRGELPLHPCENGNTFVCDDPNILVMESGCALPEEQHGIAGIQINGDPKKVMIRLTRNSKAIITRTVVPQYQTSMPNGPGCGPVCRSASFDLFKAE